MPLNRRAPNLELELEQVVERVGQGPVLPACLPAGPLEREDRFASFLCARSSAHAQEPTLCLIRRSLSPTSDVFSQHGAGVKRNCVPQRGRKPGEVSGPLTHHPSVLPPSHLPPLLQFRHSAPAGMADGQMDVQILGPRPPPHCMPPFPQRVGGPSMGFLQGKRVCKSAGK